MNCLPVFEPRNDQFHFWLLDVCLRARRLTSVMVGKTSAYHISHPPWSIDRSVFFCCCKRVLAFGRRHHIDWIIAVYPPMDFWLLQIPWCQSHKSIVLLNRFLEWIDSKIRFLILRIRAMTLVALIGKNRPDLSVGINLPLQLKAKNPRIRINIVDRWEIFKTRWENLIIKLIEYVYGSKKKF